jgi:hypothetical protein
MLSADFSLMPQPYLTVNDCCAFFRITSSGVARHTQKLPPQNPARGDLNIHLRVGLQQALSQIGIAVLKDTSQSSLIPSDHCQVLTGGQCES